MASTFTVAERLTMPADAPTTLALDFDGVLCDGLLEYFQTSWRTYCQIWSPKSETPPDNLAESFYRLRPVIETGWEMPILIRALILGIPAAEILQDWSEVCQQIVAAEKLDGAEMGEKLDRVRDEWIAKDWESWLSLHHFYPGVAERLRALVETPLQLLVVTTKEGRFANKLLQQQGIRLAEERIIGKEIKRPKHQTLRQLLEESQGETSRLWFVEDRLKTLQSVQQQADLQGVRLYLADWGYNTARDRDSVRHNPDIRLLSLLQFTQDFLAW
jgi:phosphoglycolate phosphatase-like HAD superfamily hydrolase